MEYSEDLCKVPSSSKKLIRFPSVQLLEKNLACVECFEIPDPRHYLVCKEFGHILCAKCAWPTSENLRSESSSPPASQPSSCCDPVNLEKGSPKLLERLISVAIWVCSHAPNGCHKFIRGKEWEAHVTSCKSRAAQQCHFSKCPTKFSLWKEAIQHYIHFHKVKPLPFEGESIQLDVIYEETEHVHKRNLQLLTKKRDCWFLLCGEIFENELHIWIWDLLRLDDTQGKPYNYKYRVTLVAKEEFYGRMISYDGYFHPAHHSSTTIIHSGDCLSIGIPKLQKMFIRTNSNLLCDNNKNWVVNITLLSKGNDNEGSTNS